MRQRALSKIIIFLTIIMTTGIAQSQTLVDKVAVIVNDESILESEIISRLQEVKQQINQQGATPPPLNVLLPQLLDRLILESIQDQMADRFQIQVTDTDVNDAIARIAARENMSFQEFMEQPEMQDDSAFFRQKVRRELRHYKLQQRMLSNRVQISDQEVERFLNSKEAVENQNIEYKLRHILLQLSERATPEDVQKTQDQAEALIAAIRNKETSFEQAAISVSDDSFALKGGDMGWRKISQVPSRFTQSLLKLKPGEMSKPIRSPSGFHILYLEDKQGEEVVMVERAKIEHILITPNQIRGEDQAEQFALDLRQQILDGKSLAELARTFSDDPGSALNGGDLGWVSLDSLDETFAQVAQNIQIGEISQVFESQFGYHILRVTDRKKEDMSEALRTSRAQRWLQQREFEDQLPVWLSEIRSDAFVEFKPPYDQYAED